MGRSLVVLAALLLLLAACGDRGAEPTPHEAATTESPGPSPQFTPSPTPGASPSPGPTAPSTPMRAILTPTPEPSPAFVPEPVILPTVAVAIRTPTPESAEALMRRLDGIGLRVNVLRELSSKRPVIREFINRDELNAYLLVELEEDRDEIYDIQRLYATLGILEDDRDLFELLLDLYGEGVLGFFDEEEEKLYVVEEESQGSSPLAVKVFVHEFVHALQQQHFDIHATLESLEGNSDAVDAYRALFEGDAVLAELLYLVEHMDEAERAASEGVASDALIRVFMSAPHALQRSYSFPYLEGAQFVLNLYITGQWDSINRAYDELPQSTEQILHPQRYFSKDEPVRVVVPDLTEVLGEGWTQVMEDTMGEFFLLTYLETDYSAEKASAAAEGWGGDRFRLLSGPEGEDLLVAVIVWDTEDDAKEFFDVFIEFAQVLNGGQWDAAGDNVTSTLMTLPDQRIFASLNGAKTALVFAPDLAVLQDVRVALGEGNGAKE